MKLETVGAGMRRVARWLWMALAALATFVVVFRLTLFFDQWKLQMTVQATLVAGAAMAVTFVTRNLPCYLPRRRSALLAELDRLPLESPELAAAALRHFRSRARLTGLADGLLVPIAGYGLWSAFGDPKAHGLLTVLILLFVLIGGALGLDAEARRLRKLARAASSAPSEQWRVVRSFARNAAAMSSDPVSRALWRRLEPPAPAPDAPSEAPASTA